MKIQECEQLTLFQEASPASRSPLPGSEEARRMTVTSGLKCLELYQNSGPLGLLVRTLLGSSIWRSTRCALTWKTKVTPSKRLLFRLVPSMPRTGATDARLSGVERWKKNITGEDGEPILWKTPIASDSANREFYHNSRSEPNLSGMVKMWPTPTSRDYKDGTKKSCQNVPVNGLLGRAVHMYPTPKAQNCRGNGERHGDGGPSLDVVVGGQLNPTWVEWLMGFPLGWTDLNALETP